MHIILYALSLLVVVVQCVPVINIIVSELHVRNPEKNTALNAETKLRITAKISGNTLLQES